MGRVVSDYIVELNWLPEIYEVIVQTGDKQDSRLGAVREILGAGLPSSSFSQPYRPGMARRLGFVELLQVISGYFDERHISKAAPSLRYPYGPTHAYGIKIYQQLGKVVEQLETNKGTRRAMVHIGKPEDGQELEKPCMQSIQYLERDDHLLSFVYARSWDLVSGAPYDIMVMNGLNQMVANIIGLKPGVCHYYAVSAHVYTEVWNEIKGRYKIDLLNDVSPFPDFFRLPVFDTLLQYREWAIDQLNDLDNWEKGLPKGVEIFNDKD